MGYFGTNKPAQTVWNDVGGEMPSYKELVDAPEFVNDDNARCDGLAQIRHPVGMGRLGGMGQGVQDGRDRVVIGGEDTWKSFTTMGDNLNKVIETHTPIRSGRSWSSVRSCGFPRVPTNRRTEVVTTSLPRIGLQSGYLAKAILHSVGGGI